MYCAELSMKVKILVDLITQNQLLIGMEEQMWKDVVGGVVA